MNNTLTATELASMRDDLEGLVLPDKGYILTLTQTSDGQGGFTDSWGTATAYTRCRLDFLNGTEAVFGGALKPFSGWNLTVPHDTSLTTEQRFLLNGDTYAVVEIDGDKSWSLFLRARVERV